MKKEYFSPEIYPTSKRAVQSLCAYQGKNDSDLNHEHSSLEIEPTITITSK